MPPVILLRSRPAYQIPNVGLFRLTIPLAAYEHQGRSDSSFKDLKEDSLGWQRMVAVYCCGTSYCNFPQDYVTAQPFRDRSFFIKP